MSDQPAAEECLPLQKCFSNVWLASRRHEMSIPLGLKIAFSRNMVAVLTPEGWVLLNPVRLSANAESELLAIAPFRHAVRLGAFHGMDDAYYVEHHGLPLWGVPGEQNYTSPAITHPISEAVELPIPGAKVLIFQQATKAECVVLLPEHRLLVTCDSVQHYENDKLISPLGRIVMYPLGFFKHCNIGRFWLKAATPVGGSLKPDFERLLKLDFDNLIAGHGTLKRGGAKAALRKHVDKLV